MTGATRPAPLTGPAGALREGRAVLGFLKPEPHSSTSFFPSYPLSLINVIGVPGELAHKPLGFLTTWVCLHHGLADM